MKRLTKKEMVKDMFFLATDGLRTTANFVAGMGVIDAIAEHNYRTTIQEAWDEVSEAGDSKTAKMVMHFLRNITFNNLCGSDGFPHDRAWAFRRDACIFGF